MQFEFKRINKLTKNPTTAYSLNTMYNNKNFRSKYTGFASAVNRLDIHPEMPLILGASNDKTVRVYSIDDQRLRVCLFSCFMFIQ